MRDVGIRLLGPAMLAALILVIGLGTPAQAALTKFADDRRVGPYEKITSAEGVHTGGAWRLNSGAIAWASSHFQTIGGGNVIFAAEGGPAQYQDIVHARYSGTRVQCFWAKTDSRENDFWTMDCWRRTP